MRRSFPLLILGLVLATGLALADHAGRPGHGPMGGPPRGEPGEFIDHLAIRLDLTDEQTASLKALVESHHDAMRARHDEMFAAREALRGQVWAATPDEAAIRSAAAVVAALEADVAVEMSRLAQSVRGILTEEQFEEFQEIFSRHLMQGRGPHGHGGPEGAPLQQRRRQTP